MPRWLEIVLTLIGFTIAMTVVGWAVRATVPGAHEWLIANIGRGGAWALLIAVVLGATIFAWHGHRKPGTRPNGR